MARVIPSEGAKGESAPVTRYTFFIYQVSPG
jgi:hypothetical protein